MGILVVTTNEATCTQSNNKNNHKISREKKFGNIILAPNLLVLLSTSWSMGGILAPLA